MREKVDQLVLLRLYSLEEEAERFLDQGKLSEEQVTTFTIIIERLKIDYDHAGTKEQKKDIVKQARRAWINLVRDMP